LKFTKALLIDLSIVTALVGIGVAGYLLSPQLLPKSDVSVTPEEGCDLNLRTCSATLPDGGRIEFSISPRPVPFLSPLKLEASVTGVQVRKVEVDFSGATMNMGFNRGALTTSGPGQFVGESSLAVCVTGRMTWIATVIVETDQQRIAVPFKFDADHVAK
jgi:hypothetical protein